ncbi:hypothetical protein JCM10212_005116 [Sporobolomyces blumeae]
MTLEKQETRSLILYGPHLFPPRLAALTASLAPVSEPATVQVPSAFLAFDVPGIPYVEPCHANAIVRGVNDTRTPSLARSVVEAGSSTEVNGNKVERRRLDEEDADWDDARTSDDDVKAVGGDERDERDNDEYKKAIWDRCCPGTDYEGHLPPPLEGIVYELTPTHFAVLHSRILAASPSCPSSIVTVPFVPFENGDLDRRILGERATLEAEIVVFETEDSIARLQPTLEYLHLVLRGAFFSPLSRTYLAHLLTLQPFTLTPPPLPPPSQSRSRPPPSQDPSPESSTPSEGPDPSSCSSSLSSSSSSSSPEPRSGTLDTRSTRAREALSTTKTKATKTNPADEGGNRVAEGPRPWLTKRFMRHVVHLVLLPEFVFVWIPRSILSSSIGLFSSSSSSSSPSSSYSSSWSSRGVNESSTRTWWSPSSIGTTRSTWIGTALRKLEEKASRYAGSGWRND